MFLIHDSYFCPQGKAGATHEAEQIFRSIDPPDVFAFTSMSTYLILPLASRYSFPHIHFHFSQCLWTKRNG